MQVEFLHFLHLQDGGTAQLSNEVFCIRLTTRLRNSKSSMLCKYLQDTKFSRICRESLLEDSLFKLELEVLYAKVSSSRNNLLTSNTIMDQQNPTNVCDYNQQLLNITGFQIAQLPVYGQHELFQVMVISVKYHGVMCAIITWEI